MTLTTTQALIIALAVTAGTMVTRFLPFLLFPDSRPVPKIVTYLGRTLPAAMMGLLVVYCLRNVSIVEPPPRSAGADLHRGAGSPAPLEAERPAVHRRGDGAVHGAGAGGIRISGTPQKQIQTKQKGTGPPTAARCLFYSFHRVSSIKMPYFSPEAMVKWR